MPSSTLTNFGSQKIMDYLLKGTTFTRPANLYLALFTTTPLLDSTGGVEVSTAGTGYSRIPIDSATGWSGVSGVNMTYTNTAELIFGLPLTNWGTVVSAGLYSAQTAGDLWLISSLSSPKTISQGDGAAKVPIGQISISRSVC